MTRKQKKRLYRALSGAAISAVAFFLPVPAVRAALFAVAYLLAGYDVLFSAVRNILAGQVFDENFLMTVATVGALALRDFPEAAAVMILYQLGEVLQGIAVGKSRRSIEALTEIRPDTARVLRDGREAIVSPEEVAIGETLLIRPGERIALDGEVLRGRTSVDAAALTGESVPVEKGVGDSVISGSINLSGEIEVRVQSSFSESTVSKILDLAQNAAEKKARCENFITSFARIYTPAVVGAAVLVALLPPIFINQPFGVWIERALTFLVVSCPCALVISVPLSFFCGMGAASKRGILIKGSNFVEALSRLDTVALDKTGTLTRGSFSVTAIHPQQMDAAALLDIAAVAESHSNHPVAACIAAAHNGHIDKNRIGSVQELAGMGLMAQIDGTVFAVGNRRLMEKVGAQAHDCHLPGTVVHIARGSVYLGHITVNDELKPDARAAIEALHSVGIRKTVLLTGDLEAAAKPIAQEVGVEQLLAALLPGQKVEVVEQLLEEGRRVAFVGDGINDAPVLARADVGIAMGAAGSDAAIEAADVVLMDDRPGAIAEAISIARKTMRIVRQNIVFSLAVKAFILALAAVGLAGMWIAVAGDVGVMLLAVFNALRAMRVTGIKR